MSSFCATASGEEKAGSNKLHCYTRLRFGMKFGILERRILFDTQTARLKLNGVI